MTARTNFRKTVNKLIIRNIVWRGFFYLTSFVVNITIVRILGAEYSGRFYFFLNNLSLAILIGSFSLDSGITYFVSKRDIDEKMIASFSLIWAIGISLINAVFFVLLYSRNALPSNGSFFFFACFAFTLGNFLTTYFSAFFYSYDLYQTPNLLAGGLNLALIVIILLWHGWMGISGMHGFLLVFFMISLLQGVVICVAWFAFKRNAGFRLSRLTGLIPVLRYSVVALSGNVIYFILYRIDYWFVQHYCSEKSLGNYIQVSKIGQLLVLPCIILAGTLFPQSSRDDFSFEKTRFKKLFWRVFIIYVAGSLLIIFFGKWIIRFVWGEDYNEMFQPLLITLPGIVFLAISYLFSPTFAGKGKVNYNVFVCLIALAVVVVCNFLFVPIWGTKGAAGATSAGFTAMLITYFSLANRKFHFSPRELFFISK